MYYYQIEKFTNLNLLCSEMSANCEVETSKNFKYIGTALREGIQQLYKLSRNKSCKCYGVTLRIYDVIEDTWGTGTGVPGLSTSPICVPYKNGGFMFSSSSSTEQIRYIIL